MDALLNYILMGVYFLSFFFVVFWLITFFSEPEQKKAKKLTNFPVVTIAVPAYNEEKTIQKTLKSLINLDYPQKKLEIIAINDGSDDKTKLKIKEIIKKYPKYSIRLIDQENQGKGAALNNAIKISRGEFFVCLDADSFAQKNALKKILPHFEENEEVAAVLPCLKSKGGKNLVQKMQRYEYVVNMFYKELMAKLDCIRVTPGPFAVYRKAIIQKIGGFDENNLTEDLEMALRLQRSNYKIVQTLETNVFTIPPDTFRELLKQRNRWYKGSILNTIKYKDMIFKRKFGDFGVMQMPLTLISGVMTILICFSFLYFSLKPLINKLTQLNLINFDLYPLLISAKNWILNFHLLDLDFILISLAIVMAVTSIYVLKRSHINTKEKVFKYGAIPLFCYMFLYFFILGVVWINISFDLLFRKQQQRW
ncbi:glycosyltransferase family 2 protein [Candidatus Woesearchaeota archaeon]|nr:glycosyltransferase family 2 protein [Candidatus Woesearchaeota archaeon]